MKLFGAVAVLAAATGAWAKDVAQAPNRVVMVCLDPGGNAALIFRGEAEATHILKQAGIRLDWRMDPQACTGGNGLVVTVSLATPKDQHPGELAYAMPFEGTHIVLLYDRVLNCVGPRAVPAVLGHVLAHEIVHILQGVNVHSASGIMKEHWNSQDYADMQRARLMFTMDDIELIDHCLERRASRAAPAE